MSKRLKPYRQVAEEDIINGLFSADTQTLDQGVLVSISASDGSKDPVEYVDSSQLGKTDYAHIGADMYPVVPNKFTTAASGARAADVLGITLFEVAYTDENGEKYLYYKQKRIENQICLSGEAVPVASRGVFEITSGNYAGTPTHETYAIVGDDGKPEAVTYVGLTGMGLTMENVIGKFLSTPQSGSKQDNSVLLKLNI